MVSFGDMMTLILCFFILLVSLASERDYGLLAKGVGSFIVAVKSHGLTGTLDANEEMMIFENVRRRFHLPPEEDPDRREAHIDASQFELVRAKAMEALKPHLELRQPEIAVFAQDSAEITAESKQHIDRLASTLRPGPGQSLVLEGHARDAGTRFQRNNAWLATSRAEEVRKYLIDEHGYKPDRVVARAWMERSWGKAPVPAASMRD